jgi:lysophospholipase L1-like esterase
MNISKFYVLVLLTLFHITGCHAGYYVYGDSLTSQAFSWANVIQRYQLSHGTPYLQIQAVPGLRVKEFRLPSTIKRTDEITAVLLFLGANDVGSNVPVGEFHWSMTRIAQKTKDRNLDLVCVQIPEYPHFNKSRLELYRDVQTEVCDSIIKVSVDLRDSPDGIHMGPEGHGFFAVHVLAELGELNNE